MRQIALTVVCQSRLETKAASEARSGTMARVERFTYEGAQRNDDGSSRIVENWLRSNHAAWGVSLMPSAFMTPRKVESLGSPVGDRALQRASRVTPAWLASWVIPMARAISPSAVAMSAGSPSSKAASR